jgi:hypothetical protein
MKKTILEGLVAAVALLVACGGVVGKPTVGGESHFLRHCSEGCGELSCVADICTRSCIIDEDRCSDLAKGATCTNKSVEPGSVAICDQSCRASKDCAALGSDFTCQNGFCRSTPPESPTEGGGGGATSNGGTTSNGGVCSQPFDPGSCRGYQPVFAAVDGVCRPKIYSGCGGNANRFTTLEECLATCEARPAIEPCPAGRESKTICLECGPAGGCAKEMEVCAQPCDTQAQCDSQTLQCDSGYCQWLGCD